jgi:regulation of enolase protein 1 (concanavalin A-like superfamily)
MARSLFALAVLMVASAALAAPAPQAFVSGWGNPVDPDKDCKIRRDRGVFTIEMPGAVHDYAPHRKCVNAPRLLRDFEGDFEMQVRVRIDSRPSVKSTVKGKPSYVSAGFLIIPPDAFFANCIRLEYRLAGQGDGVDGCLARMVGNNEGTGRAGAVGYKPPEWPFKTKPDYVYIRLERQGEILSYTISRDAKSWVATYGIGLIVGLPSKLKVGFATCSTSADPSKVLFDQLRLTGGKRRRPWEFVSGWGDPVDPDKDCKIHRDKDALTIEMPGSDHDYDPVRKRFNAPRLLSELEGEFDLQVRVRIDYRPSAQSTVKGQPSYVSAGFLLIYPEKELSICARLEYAISQQGTRLDAYAVPPSLADPRRKNPTSKGKEASSYAILKSWIGDGQPSLAENGIWERGWESWPLPEKAEYAYLRLDHRAGGWSSFFISPDGKKWTRLEYLPSVPAKGKIGLAAYSTSTEPSKVRFDQLKLAWDKKKSK